MDETAVKRRSGVPSILEDGTIGREMADKIAVGHSIRAAAIMLGLRESTVEGWLAKGRQVDAVEPYATFADAIDRAKVLAEAELVEAVRAQAKGNWRAAKFLLERQSPDYAPPARGTGATLAVLIEQTGYSAATIRTAIDDGVVPPEAIGRDPSGRRFIADVDLARTALLSTTPVAPGPAPSFPKDASGPGALSIDAQGVDVTPPRGTVASMNAARTRRTEALAAKAELDVANARGELVKRADVQAQLDDVLGVLSARMQSIASRVATECARLVDPHAVTVVLDGEIRAALTEAAQGLAAITRRNADDDAAAG